MTSSRPILVTGSHRSGTGWVSRVLSGSSSPVHYIWEPFSVLARPGICAARFRVWFPYVCDDNEEAYLAAVRDTVALRYNLGAELKAIRSPKDAGRMIRDLRATRRAERVGARALLKDPIALFSAEWLADRFDAQPVVLIRHPAAFAYSIVRHGWRHPFGDFLAQPSLMRDRLAASEGEIRRFAQREQPLLEQAILLWNILHGEIARLSTTRPEWIFRRHEDLGAEPLEGFADLYERLDLADGGSLASIVEHYSGASNPADVRRPGDQRRDSRAGLTLWKQGLSPAQIARLRERTAEVSASFYDDDDW
ncbi:MAG: hypothetical protein ACXWZF_03510 [Actinomycetota bacterium]